MKSKILNSITVALISGALLTGCSATAKQSGKDGWPDKFVVTTSIDENNPDADALNDEFGKDLEEYLGIPVEIYSGADYTAIIEGMASGNVQASMVSPMSYFQTKEKANAELVASAKMATEYRSAFIVKGDNDEINSLEDLKGKTFAFVDQASSSGYLYPKAYLVKNLDLDPDKLENSGYYFETVAFSGNHQTSLTGVVMSDYDAACVAKSIIDMMVASDQMKKDDVKVIGETDVIPNPAYVVAGDLPKDLKEKFKEFLLSYDNEDFFKAALGSKDMRFGETSEDDYKSAKEVLDLLHIQFGD